MQKPQNEAIVRKIDPTSASSRWLASFVGMGLHRFGLNSALRSALLPARTTRPISTHPRVTFAAATAASSSVRSACAALLLLFVTAAGSIVVSTPVQAQAQKLHRIPPAEVQQPSVSASGLAPAPAGPLEPRAVNYAEVSSGQYNDSLVAISGTLVSFLEDAESYSLILNSDGHLVSARLDQNIPMEDFQLGSTLRIVGFCRMLPATSAGPGRLSFIEMRTAADVQLLAKPSWFTLEHILEILGMAILIAGVFIIRRAFYHWRNIHQSAWRDRSAIIARERSRILEMISYNHTLDELLTEICKSTMELLRGAKCTFLLNPEANCLQASADDDHTGSTRKILFEFALRDDSEQINGKICVSASANQQLPSDREEIFKLLSELSGLAMRQSLLYRGLVYHSTHDPLTELPNRRLCESRLAEALKEAEQTGGQLAVIYIDINRFKYVNDQYGHKTGDLYLQQISNRLRAQLRPIDMLARVGGDEFVVVAPFPERFDRAHSLTARLQGCFHDPFSLDGIQIDGSASFGFARYPEHGLTPEDLTRHADHEMYVAKHEAHISEEAHGIAIITASELELALLNRAFRLAYQPQFSAAGRLTGLEALLRLDDPVLGLITPDAFISVAEKDAVIVDIGAWALRCALQDAARWNLNRGEHITVAVNVSVRQLEEPGYAKSVLALLKEYAFPPERLELELVERSLMFSGEKVLQQLEILRAAGVRISLDDFGTEQSCLSLLHKLPIDTIKLDRSFIRAMDNEPTVLPIIQAIVSMAHSLGKRVVAEAIEHVGPVPALLKMGKMDFQGYLLSRPISAEEVQIQIQTWRTGIQMPEAFRQLAFGD